MLSQAPSTDRPSGFRPLDTATLIYLLYQLAMVLLFMTGKYGWYYFLGFYLAAVCIVVVFTTFPMPQNKFWKAARLVYPLFLVTFLYEALNPQIFLLHPVPFDSQIHNSEMALLGANLSFAMQPYMQIWLNELMSFAYVSYYFYLPLAVVILFLRNRWEMLEKMALASLVTYYTCYAIFIFYPVMGPRFYLNNIYYLPLIGPFFTPLAQEIVARGGLHGGAMPSSHCAVALVIAWYIAHELRRFAVPIVIMLVLLCISTVYGRYHYIADVVAGLLVGTIYIILTSQWQNSFLTKKAGMADSDQAQPREVVNLIVDKQRFKGNWA